MARTWSPDQPITSVLTSPQCVSRVLGPPSTGATWTSGSTSRQLVHANRVPSGAKRGELTGTWSAETRQARPPSSGANQTSSSATKVTRSPCRWG
jgi:hypothetical protein